jgi:hypothetical protein
MEQDVSIFHEPLYELIGVRVDDFVGNPDFALSSTNRYMPTLPVIIGEVGYGDSLAMTRRRMLNWTQGRREMVFFTPYLLFSRFPLELRLKLLYVEELFAL